MTTPQFQSIPQQTVADVVKLCGTLSTWHAALIAGRVPVESLSQQYREAMACVERLGAAKVTP